MLLNEKYYKELWSKFEPVVTLPTSSNHRTFLLSLKFILHSVDRKQSIHVNFQGDEECFTNIQSHLFIELANRIYCNAADFAPCSIGDRIRSKHKYRIGGPKATHLDFVIKRILGKEYELRNEKQSITIKVSFDSLVRDYIPLTQNAHDHTIERFLSYFDELNGKKVFDFTPTYFERKSVFIAKKTFWDALSIKGRIPTIYFPNPREESDHSEIKSIPPLPDCLMFVTPKYDICYSMILTSGKKIDNIVLCDTEEDNIQQILQDKNRFGFNIVVLTRSFSPLQIEQIPCWNWFREEKELLNSL